MPKTPSARRISPRNFTASSEQGTGGQKFSICSKSPQKAATNWLYTISAVGEENRYLLTQRTALQAAPATSPAAAPRRATGGGSDILLFPRPCQAIAGRRTDYLLSPLWWSFHTGQRRLFSFFTALSVFCVRPVRRNGPGRAFFVSIAETARLRLTDVRRCGTITDGKTEYGKGSL